MQVPAALPVPRGGRSSHVAAAFNAMVGEDWSIFRHGVIGLVMRHGYPQISHSIVISACL